jgi:hypothetical protein
MAGAPIKFRCYQCNQLLGVARSRVGSVVACPKCATGLIVPDPDESAAKSDQPSSSELGPPSQGHSPAPETTAAFLSALSEGLPIEIADIRPEDIRAVSGAPWIPPPPSSSVETPPASKDTTPEPYPLITLAPAAEPTPEFLTPFPSTAAPAPSPTTAPVPPPLPLPVSSTASPEPVVPPIKVEAPSLVPERTTFRSRDVVLPRSVVASWSLFVLLAQALAFLAGLLAGHFLWRVH